MAGNILGGRSYYLYTDDAGNSYSIQQDDTLAAAMSAVLNDSNPAPPRRFKPRGVHVEANVNGRIKRKFLIAGTASNSGYANSVTATFTIDGVAYQSTGRDGEQLSFARNSGTTDPGDDDGVV